jgi:hypothetical protein
MTNAIFFHNFRIWPIVGSDISYLFIVQLREKPICAALMTCPAFSLSVAHVLRVSSKKQMIRVETGGRIASMQDLHTIGYRTDELLVRMSVRRDYLATYIDRPIPRTVFRALP